MFNPYLFAQHSTPSLEMVLIAGICTMVASLIGFGIGYFYGKNNLRWQFKRLAKDASKLLPTVLGQLEEAEKACRRLQALPKLNLNKIQTGQLETRQTGLTESLNQLLARLKPKLDEAKAAVEGKTKKKATPLEWKTGSIEPSTGFEDQTAISENLAQLVKHCEANELTGGFLLLKMNKASTFKDRFGPLAVEDLLKQVGNLALANLRPDDLVSRFDDDTFCLFLPETDIQTGRELSHQIRHAIRHGNFRLSSSDSEVLVTSSLGYAHCNPTDTPDLVLNRAKNSLERAEKIGRNQLFVHSGKGTPKCVTQP